MAAANEQTKIIERDIARLADDHRKLNERFDRHLEIYAQNGKELAALKVSVDQLSKTVAVHTANTMEAHDKQLKRSETNATRITQLEIDVSKLAAKVAVYAAVASAIASAGVSYVISLI